MALANAKRFLADIRSDPMRQQLLRTAYDRPGPIAETTSKIAAEYGYKFTAQEWRKAVKAFFVSQAVALSKAEDAVLEVLGHTVVASGSVRVCCCGRTTNTGACP